MHTKLKMAEKKIVIPGQVINYEGIFSMQELYLLIDSITKKKDYDKVELMNSEQVFDEGKDIVILLDPYKKINDYAKLNLWIKMIVSKLKDVEVEVNGRKKIMNKGSITIVMQGFLHTDYEGRWEQKPWFIFLRTLFDKFFFKLYTNKFEDELKKDFSDLFNQIKAYLNLQRY